MQHLTQDSSGKLDVVELKQLLTSLNEVLSVGHNIAAFDVNFAGR